MSPQSELESHEETLRRLRARRAEAAYGRKRRARRLLLGALVTMAGVAALAVGYLQWSGTDARNETNAGAAESGAAGNAGGPGTVPPERDQANWRPWKGPVPILMYHPIQRPIPGSAYPDLFLAKRDFADQVRWLKRSGFEAVTLNEVLASWFDGGELPPKPVVLSFDDGYQSQYLNAFPVMQKVGWPGVLNLKARDADIHDDQVVEMVSAGWELASHSVSHRDLPTLSTGDLQSELTQSRRILERRYDTQVTDFCYPAGRYDDEAIAAVKRAGYRSATSTDPGLARPADVWSLDRIRIEYGDGAPELRQKLASAGA